MLRRSLASEFVRRRLRVPGRRPRPRRQGPRDARPLHRAGRPRGEALPSGSRTAASPTGCRRSGSASRRPGVLVAAGPGGAPAELRGPRGARPASRTTAAALNAGERSFLDICARRGPDPAGGRGLYYVGHWITPEGPPRRYDTRFFVAGAPADQTAVPRRGRDHRPHVGHAGRGPWPGTRPDEIEHAAPDDLEPPPARRASPAPTSSWRRSRPRRGPDHASPRSSLDEHGRRRSASRSSRADLGRPATGTASGPRPTPVARRGVGPADVVVGEPVAVADGVVRLTAANPGFMTGPGTNTYLVGSDELAVDRPGPGDRRAPRRDRARRLGAGRGRSAGSLVTHHHPDHAPAAPGPGRTDRRRVPRLRPRGGGRPRPRGRRRLRARWPGFALRALHTPGHASDHLCWLLEGERRSCSRATT